jgi:molecular chaperone GrpE
MHDENTDDITIESEGVSDIGDVDPTEVDEHLGTKIKKLQEALKACETEKREYLDGWQRAKADFVNFSRRSSENQIVAEIQGRRRIVETLLPALDGFGGALQDKTLSESAQEGIRRIYESIETALRSEGVESYGSVGEAFDPLLEEAVGNDIVTEKEQDGIVTAVLARGWKIGDIVVRPARVRVGQIEE